MSAAALVVDMDLGAAGGTGTPHPGGAARKEDSGPVASEPTWRSRIEADPGIMVVPGTQIRTRIPGTQIRIRFPEGGMGKGRHARKKSGAAGTATRSDTSPSSAHILGEMVDNKGAALINMEAAPTTTEIDLTNTEGTPPWCVNQSSTTSITWSRPSARILSLIHI